MEEISVKPSVTACPRCDFVTAIEYKYCSKCSYPLVPSAYDEIKQAEEERLKKMEKADSYKYLSNIGFSNKANSFPNSVNDTYITSPRSCTPINQKSKKSPRKRLLFRNIFTDYLIHKSSPTPEYFVVFFLLAYRFC